jgi:uncharacterized protein
MISRLKKNAHVSTIVPSLFRKVKQVPYKRQRFTTEDNDFLDIDTLLHPDSSKAVLLLHGLEGSSKQHYIQHHAAKFFELGHDVYAINFRSCSGEMNRTLKLYHSGETSDLRFFINSLLKQNKYTEIKLLGFSLGGNVVLKYLGEEGDEVSKIITEAYAISTPIDLKSCSKALASGFNRFYALNFMLSLRVKVKELAERHNHEYLKSIDVKKLKDFYIFDELVTAPLNNFKSNEDYWAQASSRPYLNKIRVKTKLINAKNDPFLGNEGCYPTASEINNPLVELVYPDYGGHVGTLSIF